MLDDISSCSCSSCDLPLYYLYKCTKIQIFLAEFHLKSRDIKLEQLAFNYCLSVVLQFCVGWREFYFCIEYWGLV